MSHQSESVRFDPIRPHPAERELFAAVWSLAAERLEEPATVDCALEAARAPAISGPFSWAALYRRLQPRRPAPLGDLQHLRWRCRELATRCISYEIRLGRDEWLPGEFQPFCIFQVSADPAGLQTVAWEIEVSPLLGPYLDAVAAAA